MISYSKIFWPRDRNETESDMDSLHTCARSLGLSPSLPSPLNKALMDGGGDGGGFS